MYFISCISFHHFIMSPLSPESGIFSLTHEALNPPCAAFLCSRSCSLLRKAHFPTTPITVTSFYLTLISRQAELAVLRPARLTATDLTAAFLLAVQCSSTENSCADFSLGGKQAFVGYFILKNSIWDVFLKNPLWDKMLIGNQAAQAATLMCILNQ